MSNRALSYLKGVLALFPETPDHASCVHAALVKLLAQYDYSVNIEYPCDVSETRKGRIDIVAQCPTSHIYIAIEIDCRKPRKNSIRKLNNFASKHNAVRVVCLRGVNGPTDDVDGVDLVYALPVRMMGRERKVSVAAAAREVGA